MTGAGRLTSEEEFTAGRGPEHLTIDIGAIINTRAEERESTYDNP